MAEHVSFVGIFSAGCVEKNGGGFRVHWSGILAVRGAKNWVLSCCSYVRGKEKHVGECHQCVRKNDPTIICSFVPAKYHVYFG